jgi:hypothetical protein
MFNTDNATFNAVMDKMLLNPDDRRLGVVTPSGAGHRMAAVGMIVFSPESIASMERIRDMHLAQLAAMDTMITLSKLGAQMGVKLLED